MKKEKKKVEKDWKIKKRTKENQRQAQIENDRLEKQAQQIEKEKLEENQRQVEN
jgi:hypothetical protein